MKKQLETLVILLITLFSIVSFANKATFQAAGATYVEGAIIRDTTWTRVDSPYVVSRDTIIYPNATLFIESNAEVRFGGNFSLIVQGRLIANGTSDKRIAFTSNKHIPSPHDWVSIEFRGTSPSILANCDLEYGADGILIENGTLSIEHSSIRFNSGNGIKIADGHITARSNEIDNNTASGIYITGNNDAAIQNNTIEGNQDGITLAASLAEGIDIRYNKIRANKRGGITLQADAYSNVQILNNIISENHYGFYVSTNADTLVTRNYILNNTNGIFYERGIGHKAYLNDIVDNELGMDVAPVARVDATHNYWGHKSGPSHATLNPYGRGNPVCGNGVNLDFIYFLTAPIDYSNSQPTARLWTDKTIVTPNQTIAFIGTDSYDDGRIDQYYFTFGDGNSSGWTPLTLFEHSYLSTGDYVARLKVEDDFEAQSSEVYTTVYVRNIAPLQVSVTLGEDTVNYNEDVSVTVHVSNGTAAMENTAVTLFPVKGGTPTPQSGITNSTGYFVATFHAPDVTEITNVRIIARANKTGYADGSDYKYLKVLPPLTATITSDPPTMKSEQTAILTVQVDCGLEPVAEALVTLTSDSGFFTPYAGFTDANGSLTSIYTAPQTFSTIDVMIMATISKTGFAIGHSEKSIVVEPRTLAIEASASPAIILSEETSSIAVHVTSDSKPVAQVGVTISSNAGGTLHTTTEISDSNGDVSFAFTAPQTTTLLDATFTLTATKVGYVSAGGQISLLILPKVLNVQATTEPETAFSESKMNITVQVSYETIAIPEANITVASDSGGNFSVTSKLTNPEGLAAFVFTAPPVNMPTNISIAIRAAKSSYADGEKTLVINVNPGILKINITSTPKTVNSGQDTFIDVYVKCNATPVANASVIVAASNGSFAFVNATTDPTGHCTFIYTAPRTMTQVPVNLTVNVTKNGYISTGNQTTLTVIPETATETPQGLSIITLLLIIIPIVIVVIVLVLIKLKVIGFSLGESEEQA